MSVHEKSCDKNLQTLTFLATLCSHKNRCKRYSLFCEWPVHLLVPLRLDDVCDITLVVDTDKQRTAGVFRERVLSGKHVRPPGPTRICLCIALRYCSGRSSYCDEQQYLLPLFCCPPVVHSWFTHRACLGMKSV